MLDGIPIQNLSAPVLVGITVLLIIFGRLVPWWLYKAKSDEAEKWRKAFEAEREARVTSNAQTAELLELAKTTHSIIVAVLTPPPRQRPSGGAYVVPTQKK